MKNHLFYKLIHAREMTTTLLASLVGTSRAHLTEVLNNKPGHGYRTRRKIFPWILPEEASALGWRDEYDLWLRNPRAVPAAKHILQAGELCDREGSSGDTETALGRPFGEGNTLQPVST